MLTCAKAANAIYQQDVSRQLGRISALTADQQSELATSALGYLDQLPVDLQHLVREAYAHGLRMVFTAFTAMMGACLLVGLLIKVWSSILPSDICFLC